MKRKHKSKESSIITSPQQLDLDTFLLNNRHILLFDIITNTTSEKICKQLLTLEFIDRSPIIMWLNSPGGSVDDGFAIIDMISSLNSPVITVNLGSCCSMAALLFLIGTTRYVTDNSNWMLHDISAVFEGKGTVLHDKMQFLESEIVKFKEYVKNHSKLTDKEIEKAINGELWLNAQQCIDKGIATAFIKDIGKKEEKGKNK